jgi:phage terminase small subunit
MAQLKKEVRDMLTPKQEKFAQSVALENMNYSDAYRSAYNTDKMTDKTVNEKASLLKDEDKIKARIEELRQASTTPKVMTAQRRKEWLTEVVNNTEIDIRVRLQASDQLNKMEGQYVQKVEADVKEKVTINIELSDD